MDGRVVDVPAAVRRKAAAQGTAGRRWLERLGAVVGELERDWGVAAGAPLGGGSDSYVAEAVTRDGEPAVLKVALPGAFATHQIACLRRAAGRGYARLLACDEERAAMLLERLGPSLGGLGLPVEAQIDVVCATLRESWAAPADPSFASGADKACALADFIAATWEALGRPCP